MAFGTGAKGQFFLCFLILGLIPWHLNCTEVLPVVCLNVLAVGGNQVYFDSNLNPLDPSWIK
jgi:hypothetical protein